MAGVGDVADVWRAEVANPHLKPGSASKFLALTADLIRKNVKPTSCYLISIQTPNFNQA